MVNVTPRAHRATWAREKTQYDPDDEPQPPPPSQIAMSPKVQAVCERIEKGVESLLESISAAHHLYLRGCVNEADREALRAVAKLVERRIGKPVRYG